MTDTMPNEGRPLLQRGWFAIARVDRYGDSGHKRGVPPVDVVDVERSGVEWVIEGFAGQVGSQAPTHLVILRTGPRSHLCRVHAVNAGGQARKVWNLAGQNVFGVMDNR